MHRVIADPEVMSALVPPQPAAGSTKRDDVLSPAGHFFEAFFRQLEQRRIAYVILHGYDSFPGRVETDVDYAVAEVDLPKIMPLLAALTRDWGWVVAQCCEHSLYASYTLVIDPSNTANHLALDVCSHFTKAGCLLASDALLLADRRRHDRGFFVPSPAAEFIYLLAKLLAKNTPVADRLARLRELWAMDEAGAQRLFTELFGPAAGSVERQVRDESTSDWAQLRQTLRARSRYGPRLMLAETARRARRALRPAGIHIALLGPDGTGKSTLADNLRQSLLPCFPRQRVFKFRPDVFDTITPSFEPEPHLRQPRGRVVSWAKVLYYFADWWVGFWLRLVPEQRRGTLIIFDRTFGDVVIDPRRYLIQLAGVLAAALSKFVPRADATFVLDADPAAVHARKPELSVAELQRQREAFRRLAAVDSTIRLVSADQPEEEVTRVVCHEIVNLLGEREERRSQRLAKRWFDVAFGAMALVVFAPLLVVLALLVRVKLGTPVLFHQQRPGRNGRPFTICKFRTMTDRRDPAGRLLPDAERLTRFGKFLRSTSLDELPELLNVLRGEMSLVGPRPLLMEYLPLYSADQKRRHDVLPGITGWAQVNGRNAASWPRKFALDVWYVDHQSLWLDLKIIALTVWTVLKREGINQPGRATADRFRGGEETQPELATEGQIP